MKALHIAGDAQQASSQPPLCNGLPVRAAGCGRRTAAVVSRPRDTVPRRPPRPSPTATLGLDRSLRGRSPQRQCLRAVERPPVPSPRHAWYVPVPPHCQIAGRVSGLTSRTLHNCSAST
jgi:hypothetical protein